MALGLNFTNMADLDKGRVGIVFQNAINVALVDMVNRPCNAGGKTQRREVHVVLTLEPNVKMEPGVVPTTEDVECEVKIFTKIPKHVSSTIRMGLNQSGLYFTIDKSIEHEVRTAGGEQLPEFVTLRVRPCLDPLLVKRTEVKCALIHHPGKPIFRLKPLAGELEAVEESLQTSVAEFLKGHCKCSVFYGTESS